MSFYLFIAVCVLGVDFLLYVLFQWMYGDKRRAIERKLAECQKGWEVRPFVRGRVTEERLQKVREKMKAEQARLA